MENPVRSKEKYKKKNHKGFACDCQVGSVTPELVKNKIHD